MAFLVLTGLISRGDIPPGPELPIGQCISLFFPKRTITIMLHDFSAPAHLRSCSPGSVGLRRPPLIALSRGRASGAHHDPHPHHTHRHHGHEEDGHRSVRGEQGRRSTPRRSTALRRSEGEGNGAPCFRQSENPVWRWFCSRKA